MIVVRDGDANPASIARPTSSSSGARRTSRAPGTGNRQNTGSRPSDSARGLEKISTTYEVEPVRWATPGIEVLCAG